MRRHTDVHYLVFSLLLATALMTGCRAAMSNPADRIQPPPETLSVPLKFGGHNFEALCFNTIGCKVFYNGRYQHHDEPDVRSPPPPSPDYLSKVWGSVEIGIDNFPPPAEVHWKSLDGSTHEAKVDMHKIFKDELIWHKTPKADMADFYRGPFAGAPDIYLEINDRTINVYMAMFIPTRTEQTPGNKNSDYRNDLILVWTNTY